LIFKINAFKAVIRNIALLLLLCLLSLLLLLWGLLGFLGHDKSMKLPPLKRFKLIINIDPM
jgi:hypothetical protein